MPMYTFECRTCHQQEDRFSRMNEVPEHTTCGCGGRAVRIFTAPQVHVFQEFVTRHITGTPVRITSRRQETDLCRAHGLETVSANDTWTPKKNSHDLPPLREQYERKRHEMGIV
jgi:putative FmdB family regulatory protein